MKSLRILIGSLFLIAVVSMPGFAQGAAKIGYVDLSRLFDEYHKTKEYDKVLETKHNELETIGKDKVEKIRESESKLALMKDDQKKALEDEINTMRGEAKQFIETEQMNLNKERNEKIREILLEIEKIVSDFAQKEGYDIILNDRVLIYGNPADDLTEKVLGILNK